MDKTNEYNIEKFSVMYRIIEDAKKSKNWEIFKSEIEKFDVSITNGDNETILHNLVYNVPVEITELVLKKGGNPNIANSRYGRNPSFYANSLETHQVLVKYGADINYQDESGWTAAQMNMSINELLLFYIEEGLNIELKDIAGRTMLFETIFNRDEKNFNFLLEKGANIDSVDNFGLSPLFYAIIGNNENILFTLLKNNASNKILTIKDYDIGIAETPLILPKESSVFDLTKLIKDWIDTANDSEEWIAEFKTNFYNRCKIIEKFMILKLLI
ncbi:ankyrin repeat domain-containing protein [Flavobacterium sp. I3-2]|uniref:ankyrin repeat domain-containing protein n=1 Tax=Flavobacterium sp. I3-2 TaxID=2748319 RepID=UPI0015A7759D|nr:ankyrin repeat domain-containing protein [Flavobacterium sp. I3-2]